MQISSALVWESRGEARREDVVLSDELSHGANGGLAVLSMDGQSRAMKPDELPEGSVLLIPPEVSAEELAAIRQSGYSVYIESPQDQESTGPGQQDGGWTREEAMAAADAELSEVVSRLDADLRRRHPDLYDDAGQMRPAEYERLALRLTGGKRMLTHDDILRLGQRRVDPEDDTRPLNGS